MPPLELISCLHFNQAVAAAAAADRMLKTGENIVKVEDCLSSDEQEEKEGEENVEEVEVPSTVSAQSGSASPEYVMEQQNLSSEGEGSQLMGSPMGAATPTPSVQSASEQLQQLKQPILAELPHGSWEYQPNQVPSAVPKPKTKSQQSHAKKDRQVRRPNQVFHPSFIIPSHLSKDHGRAHRTNGTR